MKVLVTGGAGYIGSTIVSACDDAGIQPVVLDDLSRGPRAFARSFPFYQGNVADPVLIDRVYADHPDLDAVVHCAARTVVPDSMRDPLGYYEHNVTGLVALLGSLRRHACRRLLFSSSAAIYAPAPDLVVDEHSPIRPDSPYAATKAMCERILADVAAATDLRVLSLRYFNPVGADPALRTGPYDPAPTHVMGRLLHAHLTSTPFTVHGTDWPTRDGSAMRDYTHVWDLASAHVLALRQFDDTLTGMAYDAVNLGTGRGTTVLELVRAFEHAVGRHLDVRVGPARPGDVVGSYARPDKAERTLGWSADRPLEVAVSDLLAWQSTRG